MTFRYQLRYQVVKLLKCSNKQAEIYCLEEWIEVNNQITKNFLKIIEENSEIKFNGYIVKSKTEYLYVIFHKPYLYECTNNRRIKHNMYELLPIIYQDLFSIGRLDKNSEGIILLTNNGSIYSKMVDLGNEIEKEYVVTTHFPISNQLKAAFETPFLLGNRYTLPAKFEIISEYQFKVTLKEGINRQIRRICAKNDNQVKRLVRIRFGNNKLGNLKAGEYKRVENF